MKKSFVLARICLGVVLGVLLATDTISQADQRSSINNRSLGVIINQNDPESIAAATEYMSLHNIPAGNAIHVSVPKKDTLTLDEFERFQRQIDEQMKESLAALVLVWSKPYRVDCMSITAAVAFRGDLAACANGCRMTRTNRWYYDPEGLGAKTRDILPTMLMTGGDLSTTRALMQRGASTAKRSNHSKALLVVSGDANRDVRTQSFREITLDPPTEIDVVLLHGFPSTARDVMFYFTGAVTVPHLEDIGFLPGAVADHLTSHGGTLYSSSQMSALEWIRAGATATYGTVVEPCNTVRKFPDAARLMHRYTRGDTVLQAYWSSVEMPGQGLFIGDPLARPFANP